MDVCIEYINRKTYKYKYTYSLPHSSLNHEDDYIYFKLQVCVSEEKTKSGYAEIGIIDKEGLTLYPCKVKIGHVYIKGAVAVAESLNRYRSEDTLYIFSFDLFDRDFSKKVELTYTGTVHEFAGCCQILNFYIDNHFDINDFHIEKLENKYRHYASRFGIEAYTMLDISENIQFTNFIDFINSAENRAYSECEYNFRRGEYAHDYWETLTFKTNNSVFAEIVESVLHRPKTMKDGLFCIEYEYKEDTYYGGGISVMVEKEGIEEVKSQGVFKKKTIMKIINESCRTFPSELYIICKLISQ